MIFKPELVEKILAGEKTQTRRPMSQNPRSPWWARECRVRAGTTVALQPGRGQRAVGRLRILEVRRQALRAITEGEAVAEGFAGRAEFFAYWQGMYGDLDLDQYVWAITFEPE